MNSKAGISVKTPLGQTESKEAQELCAQGSCGAALASQHDIDKGVQCYFKNSTDEACYGSVRVQPQSYQDDLARVVFDTSIARPGNVKLSVLLRERLLSCHPTKTINILFGFSKFKKEVRNELERSPLMFGDFRMNEKQQYLY